jgi:hypothetical protein
MSGLDKDIHQKESAIRFCLLTNHLPFLEVIVKNHRELSDSVTTLTDIDVLGITIDASGQRRRIVFDCKTLGKTSPINRAFWAGGLMQYTSSNEAYVILGKRASEAHRLSARHINVYLFDEKQFANYSESYSLNFKLDYCYSTNISNWVSYAQIFYKNSLFEKYGHFLNSESALELDVARGVRRLIAALQKGRGEFNPERQDHMAIYYHSIMVFSFLMSQIVQDLKNVIDYDAPQEDFERILKLYIWGGHESFKQRQEIKRMFSDSQPSSTLDLEMPQWDSFIELVRKLLDSPTDVFKCCFPMREISLRSLSNIDNAKDLYLARTIASNGRIRQFLTSQAKYLVKATRLPFDFEVKLTNVFDELKEKLR